MLRTSVLTQAEAEYAGLQWQKCEPVPLTDDEMQGLMLLVLKATGFCPRRPSRNDAGCWASEIAIACRQRLALVELEVRLKHDMRQVSGN